MMKVPHWLMQRRRICAALKEHRPLAPEDANALLAAFDASAAASWDDGPTSVAPIPGSLADFGKLIAEETDKWGKVVKFAGIKPQ